MADWSTLLGVGRRAACSGCNQPPYLSVPQLSEMGHQSCGNVPDLASRCVQARHAEGTGTWGRPEERRRLPMPMLLSPCPARRCYPCSCPVYFAQESSRLYPGLLCTIFKSLYATVTGTLPDTQQSYARLSMAISWIALAYMRPFSGLQSSYCKFPEAVQTVILPLRVDARSDSWWLRVMSI